MNYGTAFKNFVSKQQQCCICGKILSPYEAGSCDWNMQRPGKYVFWHKECYKQAKRGNKNG